jgi:uncharacterized protein
MQIEVIDSLAAIPVDVWDALVAAAGGNVFLSHAYLHGLHATGCATARAGWQPCYLIARNGDALIGALPMYLKAHSYGEYVFDWAWADAYARAGGDYYPKLLSAVPFTPCSGPRVLAVDDSVRLVLMRAALTYAKDLGVSSLHVLFPSQGEATAWQNAGLMLRQGVQFHWENSDYADFDAMLIAMAHDKRKRIKQDRRYVAEASVTWRTERGANITKSDWAFFYRCYETTYRAHMSTPYLSLEFFQQLGARCGDAPVLFIGERNGKPLCTSLCIASGNTLYGRYWGTLAPLKSLHFEVGLKAHTSWRAVCCRPQPTLPTGSPTRALLLQ